MYWKYVKTSTYDAKTNISAMISVNRMYTYVRDSVPKLNILKKYSRQRPKV